MTSTMVKEILEIMKSGKEPYLTDNGWVEFWRIAMKIEEEQSEEMTA